MQARRRSAATLASIVLLTLVWGGIYIERTSFVHQGERVYSLWDDAMISMQYARNLRDGNGLVWNAGGERVQGFTNMGVTLAMAALHFLPLPQTRTSLAFQILTLAMLAAMVVLVWGTARRMYPEIAAIAWGAAFGMLACAPVAIWTLQGSDVPFVTLWLLISAFILAGPAPATFPLMLALGAGLVIRPDTAIYYLPLLVCAARVAGGGRKRLLLGGSVLFAVVAGQMLWSLWYYGDPLPNTYYLKATGTPRLLMLASGLGELLPWLPYLALPTALAALTLRRDWQSPLVRLFAALIVLGQGYNLWVGGDFLFGYGSRFVVPTLPFLLILAIAGAWRLFARWVPAGVLAHAFGRAGFVAVALAIALLANPPPSNREWLSPSVPTMNRNYNEANHRFARYLHDQTEPDTSLGAYWGGVPVYFSGRPAIDLLGKSDRHIARLHVDRFIPGHSKWDWTYILRVRKPDIIEAPSRGLGERLRFRRSYYRVITRHHRDFYMRKDAIGKLRDRDVVLVDLSSGEKFPPPSL